MLAQGAPDKPIQPIDVRDVATFALDQGAGERGGAYNCVAPVGRETMGGLLTACVLATGSVAQLAWAPDKLHQSCARQVDGCRPRDHDGHLGLRPAAEQGEGS
ncbi:hypothetical protein [Streptomyces sp. NPDC101166]|uniref:hypothetical protein n=1 Tax=Streptomyces sp. NPDC101166 TaxID=3366120 RepID=UPI00380DB8A8